MAWSLGAARAGRPRDKRKQRRQEWQRLNDLTYHIGFIIGFFIIPLLLIMSSKVYFLIGFIIVLTMCFTMGVPVARIRQIMYATNAMLPGMRRVLAYIVLPRAWIKEDPEHVAVHAASGDAHDDHEAGDDGHGDDAGVADVPRVACYSDGYHDEEGQDQQTGRLSIVLTSTAGRPSRLPKRNLSATTSRACRPAAAARGSMAQRLRHTEDSGDIAGGRTDALHPAGDTATDAEVGNGKVKVPHPTSYLTELMGGASGQVGDHVVEHLCRPLRERPDREG